MCAASSLQFLKIFNTDALTAGQPNSDHHCSIDLYRFMQVRINFKVLLISHLVDCRGQVSSVGVAHVEILVCFRQKVCILKDEAVKFVKLESLQVANVHQLASVELFVSSLQNILCSV